MKTLKLIGMVPLVLIAATAFSQGDDRAVPRTSGGGSSSDAGSRHTGGSSGGGSSASSDSSNRGGGSTASSSDYNSSRPDAATRRPRPGTGTGSRDRYGNDRDSYRGYPYSSYYYDPYAYSWGYPRSRSYGLYGYGYGYGYNDYGYSYGDYYGYYPSSSYRSYRYRSGNITQLRTLVEPAKTRVYVDGYYAGIADDFDGLLQRLNISPGRHDITFKLEGYNSHTFSVYAGRDQTLKLRWDMVKGNAETRDTIGEEYSSRSERDADRERNLDNTNDDEGDDQDREDRERESARDRSREVDSDRTDRPAPAPPRTVGELSLDIEPADASVYVDGEFQGKASQVTRITLPAGRHRIEVVRPGYRTEETEVDVEGETKKVVVKLSRR